MKVACWKVCSLSWRQSITQTPPALVKLGGKNIDEVLWYHLFYSAWLDHPHSVDKCSVPAQGTQRAASLSWEQHL